MGKYFWNQGRWKWWNTCKFAFLSDPIIPLLLSNRNPTGPLLDGLFSERVGNPKQLSIQNAVLCVELELSARLAALCSLLSGSGPIPVLSVSDWERTPAFYWILVKSWCHLICCLRDKRKRCSPKTRKQVVWYKRNGTPAHGKPSPGSKWDAFQWEIMIICKANAFNVWRIRDSVRFKNGSP